MSDDLLLVLRAAEFAAHKHRDQKRKGTNASPYINHPLDLARILVEEGGVSNPNVIAAALLHDTLEDTETTEHELVGQFGDEVAGIVAEVTDTKWLQKRARKQLQISKAGKSSHEAKLVKIADKIANLRDIIADPPEGWSLGRQREYFDWARNVIDGLRGTSEALEKKFDSLYRQRP